MTRLCIGLCSCIVLFSGNGSAQENNETFFSDFPGIENYFFDSLTLSIEPEFLFDELLCVGDTISLKLRILNGQIENIQTQPDSIFLLVQDYVTVRFDMIINSVRSRGFSYRLDFTPVKAGQFLFTPVIYKDTSGYVREVEKLLRVFPRYYDLNIKKGQLLHFSDGSTSGNKRVFVRKCRKLIDRKIVKPFKLNKKGTARAIVAECAAKMQPAPFSALFRDKNNFNLKNKFSPVYFELQWHYLRNSKRKMQSTEKKAGNKKYIQNGGSTPVETID